MARLTSAHGQFLLERESTPFNLRDTVPNAVYMTTLSILATIVSAGYFSAFGVYEDLYTRTHTASASNVGWIGSTQMFLGFAVGLPAGRLLDKGYFRQTVLAGSLIFLAS